MDKNISANTHQLFNDIYEKLFVYHELHDVYIIDKKYIKSTNLKKLKSLLNSARILFLITENQLICTISLESKAAVKQVYTPEMIKRLEREQMLGNCRFWNDDI